MAEMIFDLDAIKKKMLRKYPAFGSTISSVKYQIVGNDHPVKTAATDGKTIFVNASFMAGLPEDKQVFTMAHEVCHIALKHIPRSKGKDAKLWNIATDGVINQHLKKDGLSMPEGGVDIVDALEYDAEELYQKLLAEQQSNQAGQSQQSDSQQQGPGQGEQSDSQVGHDDHSMWEEAAREEAQEKQKTQGQSYGAGGEPQTSQESKNISEKEVFEDNEEEKIKHAEEVMRKINGTRRGVYEQGQEVCFDDIGAAGKPVTDWKRLLIRSLDIEDEAWGHKFSSRENGYAARIEDVELDERTETEIILDTSGSVSVELLKNFLRQVKTILKNSTIRVGTFSTTFHGFVEIKKESDIDHLKITVGGGTNFDAASRAFTTRKDVNKICFTDGQDSGNPGIQNKRKDIVWVSFENPNFRPDNGRVLFVPKNQIGFQARRNRPESSI